MGLGLLLLLALGGGVAVLVVWAVRQSGSRPTAGPASGTDALEVLKRRYASGEIDHGRYEQMKRDLRDGVGLTPTRCPASV